MDREEFLFKHWKYYLVLEDDFIKTTRFVELDKTNYNTFSVEYAKQYQSICSEIDVICKSICLFIDNSSKVKKITEYAQIILNKYSDIVSKKIIVIPNKNLLLNPFKEWVIKPKYKSPSWWSSYNDVKHDRVVNFKKANLENIINALSGLFLLEMYLLKDICNNNENVPDIPDKKSELFIIQDWKTRCISSGNGMIFKITD